MCNSRLGGLAEQFVGRRETQVEPRKRANHLFSLHQPNLCICTRSMNRDAQQQTTNQFKWTMFGSQTDPHQVTMFEHDGRVWFTIPRH